MKDVLAITLMVLFLGLGNRIVDGYYRRTGVGRWSILDGLRNFPVLHFSRAEWLRLGLLTFAYVAAGLVIASL